MSAVRLLENRVALVTGGASGIGAAIAELFAAEGAHTVILDVDGEAAGARAGAIASTGASTLGLAADVRAPQQIAAAIDECLSRFGRIDALVNNAGIYPRRGLLEMTEADWDTVHDVNLKGAFHCIRAVAPLMVAQRGGKIVNISSVSFQFGMTRLAHYISSKGGLIGLTRAVARELGELNIHVNCVAPGAIETESERAAATPAQVQAIVAQQCLPRRIVPLDVARVCLFLASELSDGVTGQTVNVDGGWAMH